MKQLLKRFNHYFLPEDIAKFDNNTIYKYSLFISVSQLTALYSLIFLPICILINYTVAIPDIIFTIIINLTLPFLLKYKINMILIVNIYLSIIAISMIWLMITTGGLERCPENPVFLVILPIIALLCLNRTYSSIWLTIVVVILSTIGISEILGYKFEMEMDERYISIFTTFSFSGLVLLLYIFILIFDNEKNAAFSKLEANVNLLTAEKEKSENLLLNILPADISLELKQTGKTKAYSYKIATVMFADFVNFTLLGERLSPEELVLTIGAYFEAFDNIIEKHGIEKIKTVGDAYICAAGLPIATTDNALIMINVALDFIEAMEDLSIQRKLNGQDVFEIRIGINTGPLVAGVVGIKKFAYDIWGDTVNTAARMQEESHPNRINISGSTHQLIQNDFDCEYRGKVLAKNKGQIDMYFVNDSKPN